MNRIPFVVLWSMLFVGCKDNTNWIIITDNKLHSHYKDEKYNGKNLHVIGTVTELGKDELGRAYVKLGSVPYKKPRVVCYVSDPETLSTVFFDMCISVRGVCQGKQGDTILLVNSTVKK